MRKAASHCLYFVFFALSIFIVFFLSFSFVRAYSLDPSLPVSPDQDTGDAITGYITLDGMYAIGHVINSGDDTVEVGLASYLKVDDDIENQRFHEWTWVVLGPRQSKELRVSIPCWSQVDLFRIFPERPDPHGSVIFSFKNNVRYGQRLISAVHTVNACEEDDPVATPSPTPVATVIPVSTPMPTSFSTPRTDLSDNRSDNLGCSVRDCSGTVVGGVSGVVAGVSAVNAYLPSTGVSFVRHILGYGFMLLTFGLLMRRLAHYMDIL